MTHPAQRTFDSYGRETTPPENRARLQREDQAAVTAARPVTVAIDDLIKLAGQLTREGGPYDDAVHGEGICRDVLAALITQAAGLNSRGAEYEVTTAIKAAEQESTT